MAAGVASILPPQLPEVQVAPVSSFAVSSPQVAIATPELPTAPLTPATFGAPVTALPAPVIAAPAPVVATPNVATGAVGAAGGLAVRNIGGDGEGGGEPDRVNSLFKGSGGSGAGGGGSGRGSGSGDGNGINRGMSLGDRPAQELNQTSTDATLELPLKYRMHPPKDDVVLAITIGADGATKSVRVQDSCGFTEVDELVRAFIEATYRSSPEYRGGKPVESVQTLHYTFHEL